MPLTSGQILNNRYRIVKLLGQGGFGAVYRAWDIHLDNPRAIKENLDTSPEAQRQFKREAQLLDKLSHPNLPRVIDHFIIPGQGQYLVMDFVDGEDLDELLRRTGGPLPETQALDWIRQVCDALSYLHSQNPPIIHRDIKPANIKVRPDGRAMLVDFGIAKIYDPNLKTTLAAQAVTPGYSPQEQYGQGTTDARTDVYALGATLYHLLTGKRPVESIQRHLDLQLALPRTFNPAIPPHTEAVILKAMEMHPSQRFQTAADFVKALTTDPAVATVQIATTAEPAQTLSYQQAETDQVAEKTGEAPQIKRRKPFPWKWAGIAVGALAVIVIVYFLSANARTSKAIYRINTRTAASLPLRTTLTVAQGIVATDTPRPVPTDTRRPSLSHTSPPTDTRRPDPSDTPHPTTTPTPADLPERITDDAGAIMALIPGNAYRDVFYIDIYEVTNAQYAKCVKAGACEAPNPIGLANRANYFGSAQYANYPVVYVDWHQADTFCKWCGAHLPTELEWGIAARGGLDGKKYPWGDETPSCAAGAINGAQYSACRPGNTVPVGNFGPNGYGLFDMAGNVEEWIADQFDQSLMVTRGGGWPSNSSSLLVAARDGRNPVKRHGSVGFRCARSP
jgi:serine/threonine protein kinase